MAPGFPPALESLARKFPRQREAERLGPGGRYILDQLLAQILENEAPAVSQMIAYPPRDADLAASDQSLEPSSDVHAVAEDVALLGHDVSDIDADPKAHLSPFQLAFIRPLKRLLDLDRTVIPHRAGSRIRRARYPRPCSRCDLDAAR
jgi:hypothetical protein